ncbi:HEAT repeat domain-containing protein [Caenispirillum bisanense]|uniref:HEAT repeat domain-containing protein n=1 Tax=Caenispirillum bisanense TaxID=414052 RepID=UPI0031D9B504
MDLLPLPEPPRPAGSRPRAAAPAAAGKRGGGGRRGKGARTQGDLFAWPRRPALALRPPEAAPEAAVAAGGATTVAEPPPTVDESLAALPTAALMDRLAALMDADRPAMAAFVALADALERMRARAARPVLLRLAHRFAGLDREAAATAMRAALRALARVADPACATAVTDLATLDALSSESLALALEVLAAVRHRPAAPLARRHLRHEDAAVRTAACRLARALRLRETAAALEGLLTDPAPAVARAAALTLGGLALRGGKQALEAWLPTATPLDLPEVATALVPVADDDTAVLLGRAAERADLPGRLAIVAALGQIDGRAAVTWLGRLGRDRKPEVRAAVCEALEKLADLAAAPVLRELAADEDSRVAEAAQQALDALAEAAAEDW